MTRAELTAYLNSGMEEHAWSIAQLANASGLAYETVRSAVRGQTSPSLDNVSLMLGALGHKLGVLPGTHSVPTEPTQA